MRFSASAAATAVLMAGAAIAEPLATISPCPQATKTSYPPITVTKQYQPVSTCEPTSACWRNTCVTKFPFETFAYVSTVIPCAWDGKSLSTTTVTSTTQTVTVSLFSTTITKWVPSTTSTIISGVTKYHPTVSPVYLNIAKEFFAPYNQIGPLAIPGYGGSGLCNECKVQPDGSRSQVVDVVECRAGPRGARCLGYEETWISEPAPVTSTATHVPCSTRFVAPQAGTYTFTFTMTAPPHVVTNGPTTITVGPSPWFARVTRACHRPHQIIDFTTTITKTIYFTFPCQRRPPTVTSVLPFPTGRFPGFPWPHGHGHGGQGSDPGDWSDWNNEWNGWSDWNNGWNDWTATTTTTTTGIGGGVSTSFTSSTSTSTETTTTSSTGIGGGVSTSYTSSTTESTTTTTSDVGEPVSTSTSSTTDNGAGSTTTTSGEVTTTTGPTLTTTTESTTTSEPPATTTTGSSDPGPPATDPFVIGTGPPTKYRKRALQYITFDGDDGAITSDKDEAALFYIDIYGYLISGGQFIDADTSQGYIIFTKTPRKTPTMSMWTRNNNGELFLTAPYESFCAAIDSSVFIVFNTRPPFVCIDILLFCEAPGDTTTTTTTTTGGSGTNPTTTTTGGSGTNPTTTTTGGGGTNPTTTTTTGGGGTNPTTTTTTGGSGTNPTTTTTSAPPDVSGDLGTEPSGGIIRRGVQYGGHKFY